MPLYIQPKKGIRLQLSDYSPIRSWQGGGKYWEHDFQLTIRQGKLAEFLPRAVEDGDSVFYEQMIDGSEAASDSVALSSANEVPPAQIEILRAALAELKAKAEDPLCDATKRRIIESFRLPDPAKDTDLYRLWGRGRNRRLLVLWGVEKEAGSALAPLQALASVPQRAGTSDGGLGKSWLWLLALTALLAVGWFFWQSRQREQRAGESARGNDYAATPARTGNNALALNDETAAAPVNPEAKASQMGSPSLSAPSPTFGSRGAESAVSVASDLGNSPAGSPRMTTDSDGVDTPANSRGMAATSPPASAPAKETPVPSGGFADLPSKAAPASITPSVKPAASPTPGASSISHFTPNSSPYSSPAASPSSAQDGASPQVGASPSSSLAPHVAPHPGSSLVASPASKSLDEPSTASPAMASSPEETSPATASSPAGGTDSSAEASRNTAQSPVGAQFGPADSSSPAERPSKRTVPAAVPEVASLQIVSAKSGATPKNGRIEVLLSALARNANGAAMETPKITEWRIDDAVQRDKDGSIFVGSALPVTLSKGTHRVTISSHRPDGSSLKAEADVEINVKVTEEGSVRVRPAKH